MRAIIASYLFAGAVFCSGNDRIVQQAVLKLAVNAEPNLLLAEQNLLPQQEHNWFALLSRLQSKGAHVKVSVIGGSNIVGDSCHWESVSGRECVYPMQMAQYVAAQSVASVHAENRAVGGTTSGAAVPQIHHMVEPDAEWVIMDFPVNDGGEPQDWLSKDPVRNPKLNRRGNVSHTDEVSKNVPHTDEVSIATSHCSCTTN